MGGVKQGRIEVHWRRGRSCRSGSGYRPDTEIALIKSGRLENPDAGFVLRLARTDDDTGEPCRVTGVTLQPAKDRSLASPSSLQDLDSLLSVNPMQSSISDKRYSYIGGLVESIRLQSPASHTAQEGLWTYTLRIKRAETDIQLDWSDGERVWPGVMDLVRAMEEIYSKLLAHRRNSLAP